MTITREQVADLQPGDVVEIAIADHPGYTMRGPLVRGDQGRLHLGPDGLRGPGGDVPFWAKRDGYTLTVLSRAPRPLYVNHPRTEPVPGDVVRDADSNDEATWVYADPADRRPWVCSAEAAWFDRNALPARLRLLVDGEVGQVVQS